MVEAILGLALRGYLSGLPTCRRVGLLSIRITLRVFRLPSRLRHRPKGFLLTGYSDAFIHTSASLFHDSSTVSGKG